MTTGFTVTMCVMVYASDHESANRVQDIAERHTARLIRGFTPTNHDIMYEVTGWQIGKFRAELTASGYQHRLI